MINFLSLRLPTSLSLSFLIFFFVLHSTPAVGSSAPAPTTATATANGSAVHLCRSFIPHCIITAGFPSHCKHHQLHSNSPPLLCPSPIRRYKASSLLRPLSNVATSCTPMRSAAPITAIALSGSCAYYHNTKPIHLGNHFNSIQSSPYLQFTITIQQAIKQLTQHAISLPIINQVHKQSPKLRYTSLSRYVSTVQSSPAQLTKVTIGVSLSKAKHMAIFVSKHIVCVCVCV
ncbi:hypothetical protein M0R45_001862 [Rubus argutus]|uniref:Uncharacterized protein n=1 Tax=Rubus argutus TaxID=59490 RepID=A0AAW1VJV1_RUBAR